MSSQRERGVWGGEGTVAPPGLLAMLMILFICTGFTAKPDPQTIDPLTRLKSVIGDDPLKKKAVQDILDYLEKRSTQSNEDLPPPPHLTVKAEKAKKEKAIPPPSKKGPPVADPLLFQTAKNYCATKTPEEWKPWSSSLEASLELYWRALVAHCFDGEKQAIALFSEFVESLKSENKLNAISIAAYQNLVKLQRRNAMREEAAKHYLELIQAWERTLVRPEDMGLTLPEFTLTKIDDYLYAARYQTLSGNYETAQLLTEKAQRMIKQSSGFMKTAKDKDALASFEAEAVHILAHRIAIEQKQYKKAAMMAKSMLDIPALSPEWREHFSWLLGLYLFMSKDFSLAAKTWTDLLAKTNSQDLLPRLYFWLARAAGEQGDLLQQEALLTKLETKFPLNFYTAVAPELSGLRNQERWEKIYGDPKVLTLRLTEGRQYELKTMRNHPEIGMALLRTEILVAAHLLDWTQIAAEHLYARMTKLFPVARHRDAFLYLSRLLYAAGLYRNAILVSEMLSEGNEAFWRTSPEQLHIYFPSVYSEVFEKKAITHTVDVNLLYALARQESLFQKEARSYAGALGIMQLMPTTASVIAKDSGLDSRNLTERLLDPDTNVELGSRYVNKLGQRFFYKLPAMIAAYNAGEFAVDRWLTQRQHEDVLLWVELIPFEETRHYVFSTWRNFYVYKFLNSGTKKR